MFYNALVRLDLFLKSSRLVKRRVVARELCETGRALVNSRPARPAKELKQGDVITLHFSTRSIELEVLAIPGETAGKPSPQDLYRVRSDKRNNSDTWIKNP